MTRFASTLAAFALIAFSHPAQACPDFSGFWKGECTDNLTPGEVDHVVMSWQQSGCSGARDGSTPYVFGQPTRTLWSSADGSRTSDRSMTFSWNADQTEMNVTIEATNTVTGADASVFRATVTGPFTQSGTDGDMLVQGPATITQGGGTVALQYQLHCVYHKVSDIR